MRIILFILLIIPFVPKAQINRSANQFARERVEAYLHNKLLKDQAYKTVAFGELKPQEADKKGVMWTMDCSLDKLDRREREAGDTTKPSRFIFYLDKRLNVLRAESYESH